MPPECIRGDECKEDALSQVSGDAFFMSIFTETSHGITITVQPVYIDGQSDSIRKQFVFAYFVRIDNHREDSVKLLRRHWFIGDSQGGVDQVEGEGVVGKQPVIPPGQSHEYNSYCVLKTHEGYMEGTYLMRNEQGEEFRARIPRFALRAAAN